MSEYVAFTPKKEFSDPDSLGVVFVNDDGDFNVRNAVEDGKGYVVVNDPDTIAALDRYTALKRVAISEAESARAPKPSAKPVPPKEEKA